MTSGKLLREYTQSKRESDTDRVEEGEIGEEKWRLRQKAEQKARERKRDSVVK